MRWKTQGPGGGKLKDHRLESPSHLAALFEELAHYLYLRIDELFNTETDDGSPQEVASLCVLDKDGIRWAFRFGMRSLKCCFVSRKGMVLMCFRKLFVSRIPEHLLFDLFKQFPGRFWPSSFQGLRLLNTCQQGDMSFADQVLQVLLSPVFLEALSYKCELK